LISTRDFIHNERPKLSMVNENEESHDLVHNEADLQEIDALIQNISTLIQKWIE